jgi:hypothetical protein
MSGTEQQREKERVAAIMKAKQEAGEFSTSFLGLYEEGLCLKGEQR